MKIILRVLILLVTVLFFSGCNPATVDPYESVDGAIYDVEFSVVSNEISKIESVNISGFSDGNGNMVYEYFGNNNLPFGAVVNNVTYNDYFTANLHFGVDHNEINNLENPSVLVTITVYRNGEVFGRREFEASDFTQVMLFTYR